MINVPVIAIEIPDTLRDFRLPLGLQQRLQFLLDCQEQGAVLSKAEREEAEGLVDVAEWLSLLRLQSRRIVETAMTQS